VAAGVFRRVRDARNAPRRWLWPNCGCRRKPQPTTLEELLPRPTVNPVENDLSRNALPYATALAGACPRLAPAANVLPREYRRSRSRAMFVPTAVLAGLALAALIA